MWRCTTMVKSSKEASARAHVTQNGKRHFLSRCVLNIFLIKVYPDLPKPGSILESSAVALWSCCWIMLIFHIYIYIYIYASVKLMLVISYTIRHCWPNPYTQWHEEYDGEDENELAEKTAVMVMVMDYRRVLKHEALGCVYFPSDQVMCGLHSSHGPCTCVILQNGQNWLDSCSRFYVCNSCAVHWSSCHMPLSLQIRPMAYAELDENTEKVKEYVLRKVCVLTISKEATYRHSQP